MSVQEAVSSALDPHLEEEVCEYVTSLLSEDASDPHAREAASQLIQAHVEDDGDAHELVEAFFRLLDMNEKDNNEQGQLPVESDATGSLRKLDQAVTLKQHDVQTYASGLSSSTASDIDAHGNTIQSSSENEPTSSIASFYANMIDISGNEAAISERARRKRRQRELRERMEQEERQRALDEALSILNEGNENDDIDGSSSATDVHLHNFDLPNLRGGGPNLLENASVTFAHKRRYGLIAKNGEGKTTLLTFLATRQIPGAVPTKMSMLLVRQEIIGNNDSAVETVLKSDVKRESVKRFIARCEEELDKLEKGEDMEDGEKDASPATPTTSSSRQKLRDRKRQAMRKAAKRSVASQQQQSKEERQKELTAKLTKAHERLAMVEQEEGGDPEPRARKVLAGLGFSTEMQNKPTKELSGGWRMRVSLASALFANPSLLLLDEPTNHLDLEAVLWLEKYLTSSFTGTLVVVSHDKHFLNEVVTDVVHFHRNTLKTYRGDISNFEAVRQDDRIRQVRAREQQEAKRAHLQKYIDLHAQAGENGVKAARQRKSKQKKLDKLGVMAQDGKKWKASYDGTAEEVEEYVEDDKVELNFPDPGTFDGDIIRMDQVSFGYSPETTLLKDVDLTISLKSRVALLGRNGRGNRLSSNLLSAP